MYDRPDAQLVWVPFCYMLWRGPIRSRRAGLKIRTHWRRDALWGRDDGGVSEECKFFKKILASWYPVSIVWPLVRTSGVVAQLEERHNGIVEVRGSRPLGSTTFKNGIRKGAVFVLWGSVGGIDGRQYYASVSRLGF